MTASYVVASLAAVVLVEALAAALVIPNINQQADLQSRVLNTASVYAGRYGGLLQKVAAYGPSAVVASPAPSDSPAPRATAGVDGTIVNQLRGQLGEPGVRLGPGQEKNEDTGVLVPQVSGLLSDSAPMSVALILSLEGLVYGSSYPQRFVPGSAATGWLPQGWQKGGARLGKQPGGAVAWATQPIFAIVAAQPSPDAGLAGKAGKLLQPPVPLGFAYVQAPVPASAPSWASLTPLLQSGLYFALATIPVGVLFGLLTTRATVRRLGRLAAGTVGLAAGDLSLRVPESGPDEVGRLERHFNRMAERLQDSIAEQRALDERNARLAERSRISRELHDSISQDLFSIGALAGGLRKALPADSPVQPQLRTLAETVGSTIQEMRALLLELRPTALEEKGLVPALADLCDAYEARVGVRVHRRLEPVALDPAAEQALFRMAQEGLSNAARHSEADQIEVGLRAAGGRAELVVGDAGRGFDPAAGRHGLGLKLMAERARELGGEFAVDSAPGRGTRLRVALPGSAGAADGR
jgi:signal transduction histidine kinase